MYEFRNGKKEFTKEFLEHLKEEVRKEREEKMCEEDYLAWAGLSSSRDFFEVQYKFETSEDVKKFIKGQIEFTSTCMYALDCKYEHDIKIIDFTESKRGKRTYTIAIEGNVYSANETQTRIFKYVKEHYKANPFSSVEVLEDLDLGCDFLSEYFKNRKDDLFKKMFIKVQGNNDTYRLNLPNHKIG